MRARFFSLCLFFCCIYVMRGWGDTPAFSWKSDLSSLSDQERANFESFFRTLLKDSPGGYVLLGEKPVLVEDIFDKDEYVFMSVLHASQFHKLSLILEEGLRLWDKLGWNSNRFLLLSFETPCFNGREFVLINRPVFLRTVRENLSLFQYALGPDITPESLLQELSNPKNSLFGVLKNDRVLIGIVLGYGTQNALKGSRLEYIDEALFFSSDLMPFKSPKAKSYASKIKKLPRFDKGSFYKVLNGEPSFGYNFLRDEKEQLEKEAMLSFHAVGTDDPKIPWFGCWKSPETDALLNSYLQTHHRIRQLLDSDHFLEKVCEVLFDD